jgi:hypothetical protein
MNEVAVCIPFGHETPWRAKALEYTRAWYEENLPGAAIRQGFCAGSWCKARAVSKALAETREPIVVIADADSVTPGIEQAVRVVREGADWAMPHLKVYRMSADATTAIYGGVSPGSLTGRSISLDQTPYKGYEGGGITVLRREVYLDCPLDPAFVGWGQEDEAWAMALNGLYGAPWRGQAPLYHLWHEKPTRLTRYAGSVSSLARLAQYEEARIHGTWNGLLEEARTSVEADISRCRVAI